MFNEKSEHIEKISGCGIAEKIVPVPKSKKDVILNAPF